LRLGAPSSAVQSCRLITGWSQVRILGGPPAADLARKRLAELPAAEEAIEAARASAAAAVESAKARLHDNQTARRALERDVAAVDTRMARFEDHKAAVKTNHEYQALTHEIAMAKGEKDAIEDRILVLMEAADGLAAELKADDAALARATREGEATRAALVAERAGLDAELRRLASERAAQAALADSRALATYEQLLKGRRGIAVTPMIDGICSACHVRLRPHVDQQVRRNDGLVQCESCQRILYFQAPLPQASAHSGQ
jgi:predicted  nucleic acid-binding Zn-ribbon protein